MEEARQYSVVKNPPNKPTDEFGTIAFGKDGSVQKNLRVLSNVKHEQEAEVAHHFASSLGGSAEMLAERDHDFALIFEHARVEVQATEIVPKREYMTRLTYDQWHEGGHGYVETPIYGKNEIYGVDDERRRAILSEKLRAKQAKFYAKSAVPVWLLIWTTDLAFSPFWWEGGTERVLDAVISVREYILVNGAKPFSEIWFTNLELIPKRIWPMEV